MPQPQQNVDFTKIDFRGATIEDLDLPPAFTIYPSTPLLDALEASYERSYSYLPVISPKNKSLIGYLRADRLRELLQSQPKADQFAVKKVSDYLIKFVKNGPKQREFIKITPDTPLENLAKFFSTGEPFAVVTDLDRRFVLGVAVIDDLKKFVHSRPMLRA